MVSRARGWFGGVAVAAVLVVVVATGVSACPAPQCELCLDPTDTAPHSGSEAFPRSPLPGDVTCLDAVWPEAENVLYVDDLYCGPLTVGANGTHDVSDYTVSKAFRVSFRQGYSRVGQPGAISEFHGANVHVAVCEESPGSTCEFKAHGQLIVSDAAVFTLHAASRLVDTDVLVTGPGSLLEVLPAPANNPATQGIHVLFAEQAEQDAIALQSNAEMHINDIEAFSMCEDAVIRAEATSKVRITAATRDVYMTGSKEACPGSHAALREESGIHLQSGLLDMTVAAGQKLRMEVPIITLKAPVRSAMMMRGAGTVRIDQFEMDIKFPVDIDVHDSVTLELISGGLLCNSTVVHVHQGATVLETGGSLRGREDHWITYYIDGTYYAEINWGINEAVIYATGAILPAPSCPTCQISSQGHRPNGQLHLQTGSTWGFSSFEGIDVASAGGSWSRPATGCHAGIAFAQTDVALINLARDAPASLTVTGWPLRVVMGPTTTYFIGDDSASLLDASQSGPLAINLGANSITWIAGASQTHLNDRTYTLIRASSWDHGVPSSGYFNLFGHEPSLSCPPVLSFSATEVSITLPGLSSCQPGGGVCQGPDTCTVYPYDAGCSQPPIPGAVTCPAGEVCNEDKDACVPISVATSDDNRMSPLVIGLIAAGGTLIVVAAGVLLAQSKEEFTKADAAGNKASRPVMTITSIMTDVSTASLQPTSPPRRKRGGKAGNSSNRRGRQLQQLTGVTAIPVQDCVSEDADVRPGSKYMSVTSELAPYFPYEP